MKPQLIYWCLLAAFFVSCTTPNVFLDSRAQRKSEGYQDLDEAFFFNPNYQYRIRKGDKVTISVWGHDELSVGSTYGIYNSNEAYGRWLMVDAEGKIEVPRLGGLEVVNMTTVDLKKVLKEFYAEFLRNPVIDVKVLNKEISILGEVQEPQVFQVDRDHNTLLEALARCKGYEFYADLRYIKVLRQMGEDVHVANLDLTQSGDYLTKNIQLYPGDVVIVPSRKSQGFDKRITDIIALTSTVTAAAIMMQTLRP